MCLLILLLTTSLVNGQPGNTRRIMFESSYRKNEVIASGRSVTINYSFPEINFTSIKNDNGSFYRIAAPGHTLTSEPGKPELPVFSKLISIPGECRYRIRITEVKTEKINPGRENIDGILFPAQESEIKAPRTQKQKFTINRAVYSSRNLLFSDTVTIESTGTLRGKNIGNLRINPVRYDPHSNVLEVITSMKIDIRFTGSELNAKSYPESEIFRKTLSKGILNYNETSDIPTFSDKPSRMVILTDTAFRRHLQPFIKWKTIKGFKLDILYKGAEYAGETYSDIKNTLTALYNSSTPDNPPPEYLLIVGNTATIPYYGNENVTDMYYGEFDGNGDYFPEMFIGRLPVADTNELKSVVSKMIRYEKFEYADTNRFHSNAMITSGYDASYANYMNGHIKYAITNYLTPENKINQYHFYYPQTQATHKDSVILLINRGMSFVNYTGHGSSTAWLHINIDTSDVRKLKNKDMYPFIISNACQTSRFNMKSLGNRMVVSKEKGAIGFIGCSHDSFWNEDFYWAVGLSTPSDNPTYETTGLGALDRLFHTHGEDQSDWHTTMGQIVYSGNLSVSESTSSRKKYYWETYNLVGDPSMIPVIGTPDSFKMQLPDTLPNGIKTWSLTADPGSYVAVSRAGILWDASHASPSGTVILDMPGISEDSCLVVITGQNKLPLMKTIYFSKVNGEYINLIETKINDASGNNDGKADFGETLAIDLKMANLGNVDANNLYARVSSASGFITIISDSVMIGSLPAGSEKFISNKLFIKISDSIKDKSIVTVNIMLKDDAGSYYFNSDFIIHAPELDILSFYLNDSATGNGDQLANPGETFNLVFTVKNDGSSSTSGKLSVTSPDAEINILEPTKNSGLLNDGVITEIPVLVKLAQTVKTGTTINIMAILNCGPYYVEREFSFRVGRIRESFESSSFSIFPWINVSSTPWVISDAGALDGNLSARSGAIGHNETSSLIIKTNYETPDSLKFWYHVSSETNYDFLAFYLNDTELFRKSGETLWERKVIPVPAGYNKMEWRYTKDQSVSQGRDYAMIDMIDFAGPGGVKYIERDIVTGRIINPAQKDKPGKEQVKVKVLNVGPDTINGFNMAYTINDGIPVRQHFDDILIPFGDSVTVTFNKYADLSRYGIYDLVTYGYDNGDDYLLNDTLMISIENTNINEPISVFPNPFDEELKFVINTEVDATARITLISTSGKKLFYFEKAIISGTNEDIIKTNNLPPAVYYLRVEYNGFYKVLPVIKARP